jgi:hypothetical protein
VTTPTAAASPTVPPTASPTPTQPAQQGISLSFPLTFDIVLDGQDHAALASHVIAVGDTTRTGDGWRLTISASQFSTGGPSPRTLPLTALTIGQGSGQSFHGPTILSGSTGAIEPRNTLPIATQLSVPAAPANGGSAAPATFFGAAPGTGLGSFQIEIPYSLSVPANAHAGTYTTTITLTQLTGP